MGTDNRDWYRDWWRKKTGYVERASFRVSEADRQRSKLRAEWRRVFLKLFVLLAIVACFIFYKRW